MTDAGDEGGIQDICEQESLHDPFKDTDLAFSFLADTSSNMYFDWMLVATLACSHTYGLYVQVLVVQFVKYGCKH